MEQHFTHTSRLWPTPTIPHFSPFLTIQLINTAQYMYPTSNMAALNVYSKSGKERHFIALVDDINALVEQRIAENQQQEEVEQIEPSADDGQRQQHGHSNENQSHHDDRNDQQVSGRDAPSTTIDPLIPFDQALKRAIWRRSSSLRKGDITGPLTFAIEIEADLVRDQDEASNDSGEDGNLAD